MGKSESVVQSGKPDPRNLDSVDDDGFDEDLKDVYELDNETTCPKPSAPEDAGGMVTLPPIPLQEMVDLMKLTGFWLNPNLRPDFPDLRGHFTNFLPQLARCRMLVQCNPDKTCAEVHDSMLWWDGGSARIHAVYHVPIIDDSTFMDLTTGAGDRWWQHLSQIIQDAVELKPSQRWLRFYRILISFDGKNERLLRIIHLGCHALTACAFFLAPNKLVPDRIVGRRREV